MGKKVALKCLNCAKDFEVHPYRRDSAKFCSRECQWKSIIKIEEKNPMWKGGRITLNCLTCTKEFKVYPHLKDKAKFCSNKCRSKEVILNCLNCEKKFRVYPHLENRAKFCSRACQNQYRTGKKLSPEHVAKIVEGHKNSTFKILEVICSDCKKIVKRTWTGQVRCSDCAFLYTISFVYS